MKLMISKKTLQKAKEAKPVIKPKEAPKEASYRMNKAQEAVQRQKLLKKVGNEIKDIQKDVEVKKLIN